ncbi:ribonuclease P protein component [Compostibacter hankyongensis]|uniref:ribonuclease P protein component n=1 Tax=Compostibacter hankyongensis TaxID=1007089 RepID=UPI003CD0BAC9
METLFREGKAFSVFPYRVVYHITVLSDTAAPAQVCFSVPKKYHRRAVDRNRIKRLTREAYRLRKNGLYAVLQERKVQLAFCLVYTDKKIHPFSFLSAKISVILKRLAEAV